MRLIDKDCDDTTIIGNGCGIHHGYEVFGFGDGFGKGYGDALSAGDGSGYASPICRGSGTVSGECRGSGDGHGASDGDGHGHSGYGKISDFIYITARCASSWGNKASREGGSRYAH